ncbi:hypothetical protein SESBI_46154 [Sesbania bispinosa]|nr:hypothetical protein SESBI_46154 [Sesbania bispinosa]
MAMVLGLYHSIKSLCGMRQNWRLRVKLVRVWNMTSVAKPNDPYARQMVFIDEEGGRIEATVPKQHMNKFAHALVEGQMYMITNFGLLKNSGKFRAAVHEFKVIFNATTVLSPCQHFSIPSSRFALMKTDEIKRTQGRSDYLFHGHGIRRFRGDEVKQGGEADHLMLIDLVDEMGEIRLALFGEMIDVVADFLSLPRSGLPVLIIQLAKVNLYKGEVGIQNVFNASKVLWNPDIPEAIKFRNGSRPVSLKEEFSDLYPRKSVAQLQQMDEDRSFIILGRVEQVIQDGFWWYMAYHCMKVVSYDDGVPFCQDCDCYVYDLTPRYKLKMEVSDATDSAQLILFDSECYALFHVIPKVHKFKIYFPQMLNQTVKSSAHPSALCDIVGHEILFRVERKDDHSFTYEECYRVSRVCLEQDVILEFKSGMDEETPLKLKFVLSFTKIEGGEANERVIDLSPQCNSVVTDTEVSPVACGASPSVVEDAATTIKREVEHSADGLCDRKKRPRPRGVKIERN